MTSVPLPELFTDAEWNKLSEFNKMTNDLLIHRGTLPTLLVRQSYIILPHDNYNDDTIDFLRTAV